ncbi:MAG: hypothetical protein Q4E03_01660 [Trueperella sp.]|nr:hypothetical protein [Trueperella sp.]
MTKLAHAGQVVADRYELNAPVAQQLSFSDTESWIATDQVLSRQVRITLIAPGAAQLSAAVDAARRTALVANPRAVRILLVDILPDDADLAGAAIVVTEIPPGKALAQLLATDTPITGNNLLALAGEISAAVAALRKQGVRHLHPRADHIYLRDSGDIVIDGFGIFAALENADLAKDAAALDRDEVRGLAVFFAALALGRDFPLDPSDHDAVIAQAADLPELPGQLSEIFRAEREFRGYPTPEALMQALLPWGEIDITPQLAPAKNWGLDGIKISSDTAGEIDDAVMAVSEAKPAAKPVEKPTPEEAQQNEVGQKEVGALTKKTGALTNAIAQRDASGNPVLADDGSPLVNATKVTMILFAVTVAIFGLIGIIGLAIPTAKVTTQPAVDEVATPEEEPAPSVPPQIASIHFVSPDAHLVGGDPAMDSPGNISRAADGNPETYWKSWYRVDPTMRPMTGIGIFVQLKEPAKVSEVQLAVAGTGGKVELRNAPLEDPKSGNVLTTGEFAATTTLVPDEQYIGDSFTLWVTELPVSTTDGKNRLEISEITVK